MYILDDIENLIYIGFSWSDNNIPYQHPQQNVRMYVIVSGWRDKGLELGSTINDIVKEIALHTGSLGFIGEWNNGFFLGYAILFSLEADCSWCL